VFYTDNPKVIFFIPNSSIAKIIRNKKKPAVLASFFLIILDNKILYVIQVLVRNVGKRWVSQKALYPPYGTKLT